MSRRGILAHVGPLRAHPLRGFVEGAAGCAVLFAASGAANALPGRSLGYVNMHAGVLGWLWLMLWPAWRWQGVASSRWWVRLGLGLLRAPIEIGALIGAGVLLATLLERPGVL
ncbi:MAG TPA: hypothetical protein VF221_13020, partial [Chloroflexota bacterium]